MAEEEPRASRVTARVRQATGVARSIRNGLLGFIFLLGLLVFPWLLAANSSRFAFAAALALYLLEAGIIVGVRRLVQLLRRRRFGDLPPQGAVALSDVTLTVAACLLGVPLFGWLAY